MLLVRLVGFAARLFGLLPSRLNRRLRLEHFTLGLLTCLAAISSDGWAQSMVVPEGTTPLQATGDFASDMIDGIDRFLLKQIDEAANPRRHWQIGLDSEDALQRSLLPYREKLATAIGARDQRIAFDAPDLIVQAGNASVIASSDRFDIYAIRWPVLGEPAPQVEGLVSLWGEGLMLVPHSQCQANVIVLPDAGQTPEQMCGLVGDLPPSSQVARRLAESGCRVVVPTLISRHQEQRRGRANLTNREYLHRSAFILGRTVAGYEVQSVLGLVDWFSSADVPQPIGIFGYGEGGMEAMFAGGLDTRISVTCVSGFYGPRNDSWQEPIDRNFCGLLQHFDAAELAMLFAGRQLIIETSRGPEVTLAGEGGAPAKLVSPNRVAAQRSLQAAAETLGVSLGDPRANFALVNPPTGAFASDEALTHLLSRLGVNANLPDPAALSPVTVNAEAAVPDAQAREKRLLQAMNRHNQALLQESGFVREQLMSQLDTRSLTAFSKTQEAYRTIFRDQVIGAFDAPLLPLAARSRKTWETPTWTGYEVQLDVFPEVFAYGALLLPKDLRPGERRPVVVCQHGLEGRPTDTFLDDHRAYHDYAAKLCESGFIVFAPQNPYIFGDRFRTLQRKAQPLGKSLFSIIVPQHQQIINWLKTQSYVDPQRIAFYGLSYGGKSAMRIPALVTDYCLSICSADFNEWVLKNASTRHAFSYIWTGEYEIFEWNLGATFNYAEMAALICPRPFMVERGHFDAVGEDHWVAFEYAKVRNLYAARLGIGDRTEIEWFVGPHTINGQASFAFLHRHLNWPERSSDATGE